MTERTLSLCPDPETLAAFVDGRLPRAAIHDVVAHLDRCRTCTQLVEGANAQYEAPARSQAIWYAAAAAVFLALLAVPAVREGITSRFGGASTDTLFALAPRSARIVEPRLSGSNAWAPYRGPMRAQSPSSDGVPLKMIGEAGELVDRASQENTAEAQHAAGVALLLIDRPDDAIARLTAATKRAPNDAKAWSDLAAAQCAAASQRGRPSLLPEALASADRALRIDANLPEALFNRALILERLGLLPQAREAWQRYLTIDPSSRWAAEAREHLQRLPAATGESLFKRDFPQLQHAAWGGDAKTVKSIVDRFRQQSRSFAEAETLGLWGEATLRGDEAEAKRQLDVARAVGDALVSISGESLLRDAVRAIDDSDRAQRNALAAAHVTYRRGRITYSRSQPAAAEPDLRNAAREFGSSPMALVARYFAANARFDQNDMASARDELEELLDEVDRLQRYIALGAQIRWELALCGIADDDWQGVLLVARQAEEAFRRLGERSNLATMERMVADAHVALGRPDEAWAARIRSFQTESAERRGNMLAISIGGAARMELRSGRLAAARSLLRLEQETHRAAGDDALLSTSLTREAIIAANENDVAVAQTKAAEAKAVAERIRDAGYRARAVAAAQLAEGAANIETDPRRALTVLGAAIDYYRQAQLPVFLPEAHLLRARAASRAGDAASAERELEDGIAVLERHQLRFANAVIGSGVLNARTELYEAAIRMRIDRRDYAGAFVLTERARARIGEDATAPVTMPEMQRRLAGSGAALLELVVLPDETIAFCITEKDAIVARVSIARAELEALAKNEARLYDTLIRPVERVMSGARSLIIVADPLLENVPFAALYDASTRTHLIERMAVARAWSATSLRGSDGPPQRRSLALIALDSGDAALLPDAMREIDDVRSLYAQTAEMSAATTYPAFLRTAANADVIHIAGHTERQDGLGDAALVFSGGRRISWRGIADAQLSSRPVVVLAACETLRVPQSQQAFALSLGGGFLGAGARDVIGTLTPIGDRDARRLFRAVHQHLAAGVGAAEALRRAQREALADGTSGASTAWRSLALLTRQIPRS